MPILPSGKKRIMEAQSSLGLGNEWGTSELGAPSDYPMPQKEVKPDLDTDLDMNQDDGGVDITKNVKDSPPQVEEYIFKVLEGWGYPPRRIEEFSDEFITEEMFPGGAKEVTITLPDRLYGTKKRLPDGEISKMVNKIQEQFGLVLTKASRAKKKVIMDFTSSVETDQPGEGEEEAMMGDDLDEIFGGDHKGPGGKSREKENKTRTKASTIQEIMKMGRKNLEDELVRVAEDAGLVNRLNNKRHVILDSLFQENK
jgi:hypothetical protein